VSLETINFDTLKLKDEDLFLDVGCGEGRHTITAYLVRNASAIGIDISHQDLCTAQGRYQDFYNPDRTGAHLLFSQGNGHQLPFADGTFDKVICSEVLEHIHEYESVLSELHRVLKPGGVLGVSVPRFWPEWVCWKLSDAYHAQEGGHIRIFTSHQLHQSISRLGFIRFKRHWAHALHVPYWWLKCLFWREEGQEEAWLVKQYHRFLVWDLMDKPLMTRLLEKLLDPLLGKSVVMYYVKGL